MREDPNNNRNRILINRVNKTRSKKGMSDTIKLIIITLLAMTIVTVVLIFVSSIDGISLGGDNAGDSAQTANSPSQDINLYVPVPSNPGMGLITEADLINHVFYHYNGGATELPVIGATGWAATNLVLRETPSTTGRDIVTIFPGRGFQILDSTEGWWYVELGNGVTGWAETRRCFINFPDVLPSIVYNITNATSSIFRSSGFPLTNITGDVLYSARSYNPRLGREEYIVPGMYSTARALFIVQQEALQNQQTIIVYEIFRPRSTQNAVVSSVQALLRDNAEANRAIEDSPWNLTDFISTGRSNHQRGAAIDAAIGTVNETEIIQVGDYSYLRITSHTRIVAGSAMHELSPQSAIVYQRGGVSAAAVRAGTVRWAAVVTPGVIQMQEFFAAEVAGFDPLPSEWWHFNHRDSINIANAVDIRGEFLIETIYSVPPVRQ